MNIGSCYLPPEILSSIARCLEVRDIISSRLVCRALNNAASPFLIEHAWISSDPRDWERLTAISKHKVLSKHVRAIIYDASVFDPIMLDRNEYMAIFATPGLVHEAGRAGVTEVQYSKASVRRGYDQFVKHHKAQQAACAYHGRHLTHYAADSLGNISPDLSSLVSNGAGTTKLAQYFPGDFVSLVKALELMPNIRRFAISDMRWQYSKSHRWTRATNTSVKYNSLSFTIESEHIRGQNKVIADPRPWPDSEVETLPLGHCREWYRGFFVLTQAASMTNMEKLEHFSIMDSHITSAISHLVFQMSPSELDHTCNAFRNLTVIKLKINTHNQCSETNWERTRDSCNIAHVLSAARSLVRLELWFDVRCVEIPRLEVLFGNGIWPNLRYLNFGGAIVKEDALANFLNRHKDSIRYLELDGMLLSKEETPEPDVDLPKTWKGMYRQISDLLLTHLTIIALFVDVEVWTVNHYWTSSDAAQITRFLKSGGNKFYANDPRGMTEQEYLHWHAELRRKAVARDAEQRFEKMLREAEEEGERAWINNEDSVGLVD
jgi:hypothetical protein